MQSKSWDPVLGRWRGGQSAFGYSSVHQSRALSRSSVWTGLDIRCYFDGRKSEVIFRRATRTELYECITFPHRQVVQVISFFHGFDVSNVVLSSDKVRSREYRDLFPRSVSVCVTGVLRDYALIRRLLICPPVFFGLWLVTFHTMSSLAPE